MYKRGEGELKKKLVTYVFLSILLVALIYSLSTNLLHKKGSQIDPELFINSSSDIEVVNEDELEEQKETTFLNEEELEKVIAGDVQEYDHDHDHDHDDLLESEVIAMNKKAPNFELKTLAGDIVKLSDYRGKKVFINFWTTWCPSCVDEMPTIEHFFEENAAQNNDVVVLSINITESEYSVKSVEKFVKEYGISFPILLDEKGIVSMEYDIIAIPTSYIVNEEGNITEQIIGPVTEEFFIEKFER